MNWQPYSDVDKAHGVFRQFVFEIQQLAPVSSGV